MGELLALFDPATQRVHHARILQSEHIYHTAEDVDRILVEMLGLGTERKLVSKSPSLISIPPGVSVPTTGEFNRAAAYYEIWSRLKEGNLPVVGEMFIATTRKVVMPDLTAEGGTFYDKQVLSVLRTRQPQPTDPIFLQLNRGSIQDAASQVLDRATSLSIALNIDDPLSLLVKPDGTFQPYSLDLGFTSFDFGRASAVNGICLDKFMVHIDRLKSVI